MEGTFEAFNHVLSFVGIRIYAKSNKESKLWLSLQIFNFIIGVLSFICTTAFVVANCADLVLFIQAACIWTTGVIMTIILGIFLMFRSNFIQFLNEMAFKDEILTMPLIAYTLQQEEGKFTMELKAMVLESQEKLLKITRVLLKIYVVCIWVVVTLYLCSPIYLMWVREDESLRFLAFDMWFPWSLENMVAYVVSFIFNGYAGYLCCIAYPGLQITIFLLIGQVIRQLKIVNYILFNLNELVIEVINDRNDRWQECCTSVLSQCMDHYVKLKSFSNRLNVICRPFYLTLILVAIILVGMCTVKIVISNKFTLDIIKYYIHEICYILAVFLFCLLGQQVDNECEQLEISVTQNWYIFDRHHKVNMRIFKIALSQRMPIYIFGTVTLSLPTFTWFIKTGMSIFTLIMSVLDN